MKKLLLIVLMLLLAHCAAPYVEEIVSPQGSVLTIGNARFEIPKNSVAESTLIRIEKRGIPKKSYEQGFNLSGELFVIKPESLIFEKPLLFSYPMPSENVALGVKIGKGFVPLAGSGVEGETLRAHIFHGGEYYVIQEPEHYGMRDYSETKEGLLIVSDIYVSDYIKNLKEAMRRGDYDLPIWTFSYSKDRSIEDNARFLAEELNKLHGQYGEFRLDVVSFGIGGLVTHCYVADTTLYQKDISPAIIAVGTPFFGSNFANIDSSKKGRSPYRFFFVDGMGDNAKELEPESDFITWITEHRGLTGWRHEELEENKNFASIRAKKRFEGEFPEEYDGDGLVSLYSTQLTPLEPEPFSLNHFELYEDGDVCNTIREFVQLYRTYNWPLLFGKVWVEEDSYSEILERWEKEATLHYRGISFEILLEINENMLKSAPHDAILITNGDNDTYPAWFVQDKGVRQDVMVVNRNLFNIIDNVLFLQKRGLPLELSRQELKNVKHIHENDKIITRSEQLITMLVEQGKRPVVFAATVLEPEQYGYPLRLSGTVYEIGEGDTELGGKYIDVDRTRNLLHEIFSFDKVLSVHFDSLSVDMQSLLMNYAASAFHLSLALRAQEKYDEALKEILFAKQFAQKKERPFFNFNEASLYLKLNESSKADSLFEEILEMPIVDLAMKKNIAEVYFEHGLKEEAIKVLARCLKENPENKDIPKLIKKYQEE